jgi:hypothetical protein
VRPAQRSPAALSKQTRGITAEGLPVHSFRRLLADLATLTRNTVETAIAGAGELTVYARPTPLQTKSLFGCAISRIYADSAVSAHGTRRFSVRA